MKFLCIPCDSPMKLQTIRPPEGGSLSAVFSCPRCGYEMAMLTNPHETQLVQSLGVQIGRAAAVGAGASTFGAGCPFPAMIPEVESAVAGEEPLPPGEPVPVRWTPDAEARLANIPVFVRPMARAAIEGFARERGVIEVDEKLLDAARQFFGM